MARVLLCTRGGAAELPALIGALRDRAVEAVVLDSSAVPTGLPLTLAYDATGARGRWADEPGGAAISAVWQSLVVGTQLPAMAPGVRETCVAASEAALIGVIDCLGDRLGDPLGPPVFQLDPVWHQARAGHKPSQLRAAQRLGLDVPATLISSDPAAVRGFAARSGPVVAKMLVPAASTGTEDDTAVMFTTAMTEAELAELDGLDLCPMIFQQQIASRLDVRATVVGRRVFTAALEAPGQRGGGVDWRRDSYEHDQAPRWAPYELPRGLADRLLALLDGFGLNYGAIDLVVRPDGGHAFLELNPTGAFAFLGADLAGAIAAAIAEVLIDPGARRPAAQREACHG